MGKCARQLLCRFEKRRAYQRPLFRFAPQIDGLLDQPSLGAVTRQKLRLILGNLRKLAFEGLSDSAVKGAAWFPQQRAVCGVLHECVLEQVT